MSKANHLIQTIAQAIVEHYEGDEEELKNPFAQLQLDNSAELNRAHHRIGELEKLVESLDSTGLRQQLDSLKTTVDDLNHRLRCHSDVVLQHAARLTKLEEQGDLRTDVEEIAPWCPHCDRRIDRGDAWSDGLGGIYHQDCGEEVRKRWEEESQA